MPADSHSSHRPRAREAGVRIGRLSPGQHNAITDVAGVGVGHVTLIADAVRTGVTAIIPHQGNVFQEKVPAGVFVANGFGKLAGITQVQELGTLETPIVLTNTLSVAEAVGGVVQYTLDQPGNESVRSVNAVVGETNDGTLNDIRGRHLRPSHTIDAIRAARGGAVAEGNVGAGTGTICFGYKGGIGTASRVLDARDGGYTVGVLVQTNFDGDLIVAGVPVGQLLKTQESGGADPGGSCMIVAATDAPLDGRGCQRLAMRAFMGLARTGGIAANGSGEYVIAFSTAESCRILHTAANRVRTTQILEAHAMTPLFRAAIEATEEAIINSLFAAQEMKGHKGALAKMLPIERVIELMHACK